MYRRLNVTLPEGTVRMIDQAAKRGNRSRFIDLAVKRYVEQVGRANLRQMLKEGAVRRAGRDLRIAQEWFHLEEAAWQKKQK